MKRFIDHLQENIDEVKQAGLYKAERVINGAQQAEVKVSSGDSVLNFCANNYLGLANHSTLIDAAKSGLDQHGFGAVYLRHTRYS